MQRIAVVGSTGAGKTTLAKALSDRLGVPHLELDALHWGPNWTEVPNEAFRRAVAEALNGPAWIVDGNYHVVRDLIWPRADTVVWLDYSFGVVFLRLSRRIFRRVFVREKLWHGNVERPWTHFFTKNSLYVWLLRTRWRRRREFAQLLEGLEYRHLNWVRLRSARAARDWLAGIPSTDANPR